MRAAPALAWGCIRRASRCCSLLTERTATALRAGRAVEDRRQAAARRYPQSTMAFPQTRLRRLRATRALRGLARETRLSPADFVYPMFVAHGIDRREPIAAMPGVDRLSIAHAVTEAGEALALGIPAVLLFGIPLSKDEDGSEAWDDE